MSNYSQKANQDDKNINAEDFFKGTSNENRELFKSAIAQALDSKFREIAEETGNIETPPPSKRHKIRINRLFRERVGGDFLPFPEVDNFYERARSKLIKLKINKFPNRPK